MGEGWGGGFGRRTFLSLAAASLAACRSREEVQGGFAGASADRGHLLRAAPAPTFPQRGREPVRRTRIVIAGAGIAGLAAARALRLRGIDDFVVLDLEDQPGGNSRATEVGGIACPLGAHYLPVPGDAAHDVQDLLEELGLRRRVAGRWTYDERHLVHSPQERLYFDGHWQDGLLPLEGVRASTLAQYRRFAQAVEALRQTGTFTIPRGTNVHAALDALTFSAWLGQQGLDDAHLRWFLDYCCRDDYGMGIATVSAWAGLHYFAARHGFLPEAEGSDGEREGTLTWPEGNGWLARALAAPLEQRFVRGRAVLRIEETRDGVAVDALDVATQQVERWQASHCIVALPVFVAARVVAEAPDFLKQRAQRMRYAPWVVVNLHLREPPRDSGHGAQLAWDNVVYGGAGLGYVVATHQRLDPRPGPTVLSWYIAPGEAARIEVLAKPWQHWRDAALKELSGPHPDIVHNLSQVQVARYGHAMAVPVPGAGNARPPSSQRLSFAHSDWAGYSVFEEAFTMGHAAGRALSPRA
ncbi:MAG: FAD-dependent oxidoreductase [Burkholderiales bacterium]|nr:FAD-dependent oxidoreductase [Burkholderiales bacterium]